MYIINVRRDGRHEVATWANDRHEAKTFYDKLKLADTLEMFTIEVLPLETPVDALTYIIDETNEALKEN